MSLQQASSTSASAVQCLASLTTNLLAWVRIPVWAVGVQPNQLFSLPFELVDNWVPEKTWEGKLW